MRLKRNVILLIIIVTIGIGMEVYQFRKLETHNSELVNEINVLQSKNKSIEKMYKDDEELLNKNKKEIYSLKKKVNKYKKKNKNIKSEELKLIEPIKSYDKETYINLYSSITNKDSILFVTNENEFDLLCRVVEAEIGGGSFEQKINVATTIINRYNSDKFPSSWNEILLQNSNGVYQYSSISDGRIYKIKVSDSTIHAIEYAWYFGSDNVKDATYFCADNEESRWHKTLNKIYDDGLHSFYKPYNK